MQQLLVELEKLCLQPEKDATTIRQIDLLMSKIERFVLVQREEFELWLITAERPGELLANLVAILAECFQYTSPAAKISAQLIVQLIPYFSSSAPITLNTFLSSLKKLATKVSKGDLIPSTSIEIIFQQITQHATASLDIINLLETMHSIKDISESNWSNISPYFEWLINQTLHLSPQQLNKLFDLLVILCESKSGLLRTMPTNLLKKISSNIDIRHTQQLIHYLQKITKLTHHIPTKLKTSSIESICANILLNNDLKSHELLDILLSLAQLCELHVFTENLQAKYPQEIIIKLLSKQINQADLLKTLVFVPYFLNHYQQQTEIYSQFLGLAHHIISHISENTLSNLNPQQKQGIRHKLASHQALLKLIDNKMIQQETPSDIIQVMLTGNLSLFKSMLQEMSDEDIIILFYHRQHALKPLLDYPHFPMFLEELLKNCYNDSCIQLILDGKLDYFYLNFPKHSLNLITQVFFNMYLHHDINVIYRLLDLLNVRKKSAKNADDADEYHQLQIKILQSTLESYQKSNSNSNIEDHALIKQKIQELRSQQLDDNQDISLKQMHAYQQAEFAAHYLMNSNGEPNIAAFYVENDVQTLLSTRLASNPTIGVVAALDPNFLSFKELMELAIKNHMEYETIVIPIHNGHHWVGISIQKPAQAKPLVTFYDSIPDAQRSIAYQELLTPIIENTLAKTISWKIKENMLLQEDGTSCGAYLIENLASDFLSEDEPPPANNLAIRQFHLALLIEQHPDVYAAQFELASNNSKIDEPDLEYTPSCVEKLLSLMISKNNKAHLMPQLEHLDPSLNSTLLTYCSKNTPENIYVLPIHINQQWVFCIIQPGQISIYDTHPKKINEAQLRQKIHADFVINSGTTPFTQTIESDNGPLLIETIRHLLNPEMPVSLPKDIATLRAMHLECLYQYAPDFYKTLHLQKPTEEKNTHLLALNKS